MLFTSHTECNKEGSNHRYAIAVWPGREEGGAVADGAEFGGYRLSFAHQGESSQMTGVFSR